MALTIAECFGLPDKTDLVDGVEGYVETVGDVADGVANNRPYTRVVYTLGDADGNVIPVSIFNPTFLPTVGERHAIAARPQRNGAGYTGAKIVHWTARSGAMQGQTQVQITVADASCITVLDDFGNALDHRTLTPVPAPTRPQGAQAPRPAQQQAHRPAQAAQAPRPAQAAQGARPAQAPQPAQTSQGARPAQATPAGKSIPLGDFAYSLAVVAGMLARAGMVSADETLAVVAAGLISGTIVSMVPPSFDLPELPGGPL